MKYTFIIIIVFVLLIGCTRSSNQLPKIKYSGYYIPVEGGRIDMKLDSVTPLLELIPQLETKNKLHETGKAYWIGYNDLMFSIAVYSDRAIEPLVNFIDNTSSYESKFAALLTLHLIGIDCKIVGRFNEEFSNKRAREALIRLLAENDTLQTEIMLLLIRDPRESDIPKLFNRMDSLKTDCWAITSALLRYDLKNIPVAQDLPVKLLMKQVSFTNQDNFPNNETLKKAFSEFSQKYSDLVVVEDTLYNYNYQMPIRIGIDSNEISLAYMVRFCTLTDFCFIGPNFQYFYKDGKITFCSANTTKRLWLEWWNSQSSSYKDSLKTSYKKIGINRI
jgi:hypothetical protein